MSERTARLDELLREEISGILTREVQDPRIGFVTVTEVEVTPDLSHANVWVSVIGSDEERRDSIRGLRHAMPFVRRRLGELRLKRIPELHVRRDETSERGTRVLRIIDELSVGAGDAAIPARGETLPTPGPARSLEPEAEAEVGADVAPVARSGSARRARRGGIRSGRRPRGR